MAAGLVGGAGEVLAREEIPTPGARDPEVVFDSLVTVVRSVLSGHSTPPVCGVGCGGPMTTGGRTVSPLNIPGWVDFPLSARLEALLDLPVVIDNDAKALALGEGWVGAAVGCTDFLAMVVSTGVGGGLVLDGRLLDGAHGNAGHIGHVIVEPEGHRCPCGARGCLEAEASGLSILALTGSPPIEASVGWRRRTGTMVGRAVASVANLADLQLAVVGGSVALGFAAPFFEAAQAEIDARCRLPYARATRIVPAGLGAMGPLVGAAAVAYRWLDRENAGLPAR